MSQKGQFSKLQAHVYRSNHDCFGNPRLLPDGAPFSKDERRRPSPAISPSDDPDLEYDPATGWRRDDSAPASRPEDA